MKYLKFTAFILFFAPALTFAQDGEALFKAKCAVCHIIGKGSTGPNLVGVKQKWEDAGEGDFLYEWVNNPQTLIASGKSQLAKEAEAYSQTSMTPQALSNAEIDAILSYVDTPVEVTPDTPKTANGEPVIVEVPNYERNLVIFYFLLFGILVQLIAILVISGTIKSLVKMKSIKEGKNAVKTLLVIGLTSWAVLSGNDAYAMSFVEAGENPEMPWLLVEDGDLYILVAINVAMAFLVLHFRKLFMEIMETIRPRKQRISKRKEKRLNKALTDAVPIEEEHTILLHHEYDGIQELDNNLPPWWVAMFYATIVFGVIYVFHYHLLNTGDSQAVEYAKSIEAGEIAKKKYLDKMAMNVDENSATVMTDSKDLSAGKTIFEVNCVACHNPDGSGNDIGPNLTDKNWIYGYDIKEVFTSVKYGRSNGMPEHNTKLNPIQIQQVSSYVLSFPEVDGKEPQGDIIEE